MVRYDTRARILDRPRTDPQVRQSLDRMFNPRPIINILSKQNADGGFVGYARLVPPLDCATIASLSWHAGLSRRSVCPGSN